MITFNSTIIDLDQILVDHNKPPAYKDVPQEIAR